MKLRYFSDLHLEYIDTSQIDNFINKISSNIDEICILAGDVGNPYENNYDIFIKFISKNFKKSFIIAGNHEYYNKTNTIEDTNKFLNDYFKKFNNISFLNNNYEIYENYCFIGTTLWSKITNPTYEVKDLDRIPNFDYIQYNRLNMLSIDFLEDALLYNENCIVITHHIPSNCLIHPKYKTRVMLHYNQCFYSDLDNLIETNKYKIKCWFYGHTHTCSNVIINEIPFLCNPIGYPNENLNIDFTYLHILHN